MAPTTEVEDLAKKGITRSYLYGRSVMMDFNPNSSKYRYTVTDRHNGLDKASTRGVTTCIGNVLDKPALRTWPMNMSHQFLFGSTWVTLDKETGEGEWQYNEKKAALKTETPYTSEDYQHFLEEGSKQWTKRSDRGKDVGHMAHLACELYIRGASQTPVEDAVGDSGLTAPSRKDFEDKDQYKAAVGAYEESLAEWQSMVDDTRRAFGAFVSWWESLPSKELIGVEVPVYSRQLRYAGTFDLAVKIDGKPYLLDLKTTKRGREAPLGIYPEYFIQLGAYAYAYREETDIEFYDLGIVNIGKDGRLSLATARDLGLTVDECERAFAFAVRLHDWVQKVAPLTKEQAFSSSLSFTTKAPVDAEVAN